MNATTKQTVKNVRSPAIARQIAASRWDGMAFMEDFMGFFLAVFAMFKLFDARGFADGFQMYDLIAKRFRPYALIYPFLELGLGLAYLARAPSRPTSSR